MGTVPPRPLSPVSLDEVRTKMDLPSENPYNGMTLEEAFDHAIKANRWEYLRVQFENWLSGGFSISNVVDALTRAFGKRDKPPAIVEDEPQEMLIEYEYE